MLAGAIKPTIRPPAELASDPVVSIQLLEEIENWKLEAKLEQSRRYFYHTRLVEKIEKGKKCYVIGRKGTGKTAISEHMASPVHSNHFSLKLSFKNFPFNVLYSQTDNAYTPPNQYISVWKFLIYSSVCKLLSNNKKVPLEAREKLQSLFNRDVATALPNAVAEWTGFDFDLKVLGTGVGFGGKKDAKPTPNLSLAERVETLESYIRGLLGDSTYVILFDELDEDYKNMLEKDNYNKYTELLTSLFKAVQDVKSRFSQYKLYPIVFLRNDIYDILQDPDKTKWSDYKLDLEWSRAALQNMLAFRISRALNPSGKILDFPIAWGRVFSGGKIRYGQQDRRQATTFDFITRSTHNRPRDYIKYMQVCAENAVEKGIDTVTPDIVKRQDKAFSNYLRSELEDEIHGILPEISTIFGIFTKLRKQTLSIPEFGQQYVAEVKAKTLPKREVEFVLNILFLFSVIGNVPKQANFMVFKYTNPEARFNLNEKICVHRGLFKALQIL